MDAYLVLARCARDDVPLALFASRQDADRFARAVMPGEVSLAAWDVLTADAQPTDVISVGLVHFLSGVPQTYRPVVDFAG